MPGERVAVKKKQERSSGLLWLWIGYNTDKSRCKLLHISSGSVLLDALVFSHLRLFPWCCTRARTSLGTLLCISVKDEIYHSGKLTLVASTNDDGDALGKSVPIVTRGQKIGSVQQPDKLTEHCWTWNQTISWTTCCLRVNRVQIKLKSLRECK